jgi:hypothetical protein
MSGQADADGGHAALPGGVDDAPGRRAARERLERLARPRFTGSAGALEVERLLRAELQALGFQITELPFSFSTVPGRFGVPTAGLLVVAAGVASATLAAAHRGGAALLVLLAGAFLIALAARYAGAAVRRLPLGRLPAANWLVTRPAARPRFLVVAHRDSKSQPVPLQLRAGAVATVPLLAVGLLTLALFALFAPPTRPLGFAAWLLGLASVGAGAPLMLCVSRNDSPGALDNATGLAALVALADRERDHPEVVFLVTDGEELGLAGASAAVSQLPPLQGVINLDGLDDEGDFQIVELYGLPRRGPAPRLVAALLDAAGGLGLTARRRTLPLGVLVDHIPLAESGLSAVTVMRGTRASLRRVHRPSDAAARLTGQGVSDTVELVTHALARLIERPPVA